MWLWTYFTGGQRAEDLMDDEGEETGVTNMKSMMWDMQGTIKHVFVLATSADLIIVLHEPRSG